MTHGFSISADFTINGVSGSFDVAEDGSGELTVHASDGDYTITWDEFLDATLHKPDSSTEDLGNLYDL